MPPPVVRRTCLKGDLPAPPRFEAYRCDVPGLSGQAAYRTHWVATHPLFQAFGRGFSGQSLAELLCLFEDPKERKVAEKMLLEQLFEAVRTEVDPRLPSRLNSVFIFLERSTAELFREVVQPDRVIYGCSVRGWWFQGEGLELARATKFLQDSPLTPAALDDAIREVRAVASKYWTHDFDDPGLPELLVDGEVRYLRELVSTEVGA